MHNPLRPIAAGDLEQFACRAAVDLEADPGSVVLPASQACLAPSSRVSGGRKRTLNGAGSIAPVATGDSEGSGTKGKPSSAGWTRTRNPSLSRRRACRSRSSRPIASTALPASHSKGGSRCGGSGMW